jgi:hypothetical protein
MDLMQVAAAKIGDPYPFATVSAAAAPQVTNLTAAPMQQEAAYLRDGRAQAAPAYAPPAMQQPAYSAPPSAAPVYGGFPQQQHQQPQHQGAMPGTFGAAPAYGGGAGMGGVRGPDLSGVGGTVQPISALNPYGNRWTIKVRNESATTRCVLPQSECHNHNRCRRV